MTLARKLLLTTSTLILATLTFGPSTLAGCDTADPENRNQIEDDEEDNDKDGICAAAEQVDDTCEAAHGEDVEACKPFDYIDEACEAGQEIDACQTAESLDDACEALFGEDVSACASLDAIDEACEANRDDDNDN